MVSPSISHYRILNKLGAGGMGEVWLAEDTRLSRKVALKVLPAALIDNKERLQRFEQEACAASALNHPNILTIHEFGRSEDGTNFIVMEFVEGVTLTERKANGRTSVGEVLDVAVQVASALSAAHEAGIIHRDIKPDNIMLRRDGYVKVLDFGLAKLIEKNRSANADTEAPTRALVNTNPGAVMGTVAYMSPEQARGLETDARTDIWSFGVVLYEMLARRAPFAGETTTDVLANILHHEPVPLSTCAPDLPVELERIISKTLSKNKDERYQTAKDLLADLKRLKRQLEFNEEIESAIPPNRTTETENENATQMLAARPTSSAEYIVSGIRRHKRGIAVGLVVLLLAAAGLSYLLFFNRSSSVATIESIAVMPFVNESGNADVEYLSDGMTETLIRSLSQLPGLNVKARSSVFRYKGKEIDAKTIGRELNVQAILNGRVIQRGDRLTLNLELIDAQTENVIWTDQYDRKSSDLVSLQNVIARDVSSKLKIQLSGADLEKFAKNYTIDPEAYRLYLQGRFYWNKRAGKEFEQAEGYFRQAVERDPNFALGYIGLADFKEDQDRPRKKEYIRRALEIDDQLAEAHASLGYQYMMDYNWAESERELKRAIELNPNYPQAHQWNGARLMMNGKHDAARASLTRALELDPTSPGINLYYGVLLEVSGRINESIQQYKKLIEMEPTFSWAQSQLARAYRQAGNHEGCVEERARSFELSGNEERAKAIRESFAKGGWKGYLREFPNEPSSLAELGEYEKAIAAIVKQSERDGRFWFFLHRTDPFLDPIRDDPRFKEAMKKLDPPQ
jgi:serine/threonine protein kinase/Tfp pilus assembly protein PilF